MAATFDISQNATDSHQADPYWIVAFLPLKNRVSFDQVDFASTTEALQDPVGADDLIIAADDVLNVSTSSSKENHVSGCSMTLFHSNFDYREAIVGGDWVFVWMFDNASDYQRVRASLVANDYDKGLNHVEDGFKFVGRVSSCRRRKTKQPDGKLITTYSVAANGFTEMDSTQYFNPLLSSNLDAPQWLADFGVDLNSVFTGFGLSNSQVLIPSIIQICFGFGPGAAASKLVPITPNLGLVDTDGIVNSISNQVQATISPNRAYQIPTVVWKILGSSDLTPIKNGHPSYADILRIYIGVHSYDNASSDNLVDFVPIINDAANGVFYSANSIQGIFFPPRLDFNMQSLWSVTKTFLNEPVNEMYTCLRVDPTGHVMPTLMIRQMPFTSNSFQSHLSELQPSQGGPSNNWSSTPYLSIPRWVIDDSMIYDEDTGRTDATRANYVHVTGSDSLADDPDASGRVAMIDAPPAVDTADIFRSGLRISEHPLAAALDFTTQGVNSAAAKFYTHFFADIMINGHLKYQGTVQLNGVQDPVCEGDNCVIGRVIYHIERVEHSCGFTDVARGSKSFTTTLSITHGVSVDSDNASDDLFVFPGDRLESDPLVLADSETTNGTK